MKSFYIDTVPETKDVVVTAQVGCTSDRIASIIVTSKQLGDQLTMMTLQCDEYVLSIHEENGGFIVNGNCDGEIFNTMSAAILANDNFKIKNNIESLIKDMNVEIASCILSVLVYDIHLFLRCNK
jgi:hypothetical protein